MSEDQPNSSDEDRKLDRIIRASRSKNHFTRPSDASIEAWLLGVATSVQKDEVKEALIRSAEFRREILGMAEDLASLTDPETIQAFESCPVPEAPALRDVFSESSGDRATWSRLKELATRAAAPRVALVGAAAVIILVFVSIQFIRTGPDTINGLRIAKIKTVAEMDAGLFVSNLTRSPDEERDVQVLFDDHRLAAEAAFSEVVMLLDGEYKIETLNWPGMPYMPYKSVMIRLVDESGSTFAMHRAGLPRKAFDTDQKVKGWILLLPSRRMQMLDMEYDSVAVVLEPESESQACIVFTYRIDTGYTATIVGAAAF